MMPESTMAEKLLQVNYSLLRDQCAADCVLHCTRVEGASRLRENFPTVFCLLLPRQKAKQCLELPAFFNNALHIASWEKGWVWDSEISSHHSSPPSTLVSLWKSIALLYVTEVKQMNQESRFLVWGGISGVSSCPYRTEVKVHSSQDRLAFWNLHRTVERLRVSLLRTRQHRGFVQLCSALAFVQEKCCHFTLVVFICTKISLEIFPLSPVNLAKN